MGVSAVRSGTLGSFFSLSNAAYTALSIFGMLRVSVENYTRTAFVRR